MCLANTNTNAFYDFHLIFFPTVFINMELLHELNDFYNTFFPSFVVFRDQAYIV